MESADHLPVMLGEVMTLLAPERGDLVVDCTVGLGGHAQALLERATEVDLIGIDRDQEALRHAAQRLRPFGERVRLVHGNHEQLEEHLRSLGVGRVAGVLADLGVSSMQLDRGERGFSFRLGGPLDMRMDTSRGRTAAEVIQEITEAELQRILRKYGEERQARRIAEAIVGAREQEPITTTSQLREVVHQALGRRRLGSARHRAGGIDAATRTFQALRIEVNRELAGLDQFVEQSIRMLDTDGRLVVISYHSLEDRIVKTTLRDSAIGEADPVTGRRPAETRLIELLTKKPLRPSEAEVQSNRRARSARLRAARRR